MNDVVIAGGGIIGAATAYFLSKELESKSNERDPTYKSASFPLSLGVLDDNFFKRKIFYLEICKRIYFSNS